MIDLTKIEKEIHEMELGQKKLFGAENDLDQFQKVYNLLQKFERDGVILVKPHRESKSGLRQIDAVFVTKL